MNASLGKLERWVRDQVKHGDFANQSEVLRAAVRQLKQSLQEPAGLQDAMDRAEASGFRRFEPKDWQSLRHLAKTGKKR